jgi:putative peptidoglycan lipid II flippase
VLSSIVVASAYLLFDQSFHGNRDDLSTVSLSSQWILAGGTTLGVLALALATLVPMLVRVTGLRPTLRFPPGVARRARRLAVAGLATLIAQQVAYLVAMAMANQQAPEGGWVTYVNSWLVYLLPYAVLAVPIATAAFPRLSQHAHDDAGAYARTLSDTTRAVLIASAVGAAMLVASSGPIARFFELISQADVPAERMALALVAFAPGLIGFGLVALLGRALYARGRGRSAASATVTGWLLAAALALLLSQVAAGDRVIAALGLAHAVGMLAAGALLVRAVRADSGAIALSGVARAGVSALSGAAVGAASGWLAATAIPDGGFARTLATGVLAAAIAVVCVGGALWVGDRGDLRRLMRR